MVMRYVKQCGLAGFMGLALLLASAWACWRWLPEQRAAVDAVNSQARHVRHDLQQADAGRAAKAPTAAIRTPDLAWEALWSGLPQADQGLPLQAAVLSAARERGVAIDSVQYQGARAPWSVHEGASLWRQRMVMPVTGAYPAVKAWLTQLLKEPALSIDELSLQRSDITSDTVQARVAVSLWWRKAERVRP